MDISQQYAEALAEKFTGTEPKGLLPVHYSVMPGKRYDRIVQQQPSRSSIGDIGGSRSVHAFVERSTGKLVKASGWNAPAKRSNGDLQSKFNLSTPEGFAEALEASDVYGSYLYVNL